jgi:hypothetical protein
VARYLPCYDRSAFWLFAALAIAVLASGCGESGETTAATPITKAVFIKRADLICREADETQPVEFKAYWAKHGKALKEMDRVPYEETTVRMLTLPSVKKQLRALESLKAPNGEKGQVRTIIAGWEAAVRKGEKNPYSVSLWYEPAKDPFTKINKTAVRYGFNDCRDLR